MKVLKQLQLDLRMKDVRINDLLLKMPMSNFI